MPRHVMSGDTTIHTYAGFTFHENGDGWVPVHKVHGNCIPGAPYCATLEEARYCVFVWLAVNDPDPAQRFHNLSNAILHAAGKLK